MVDGLVDEASPPGHSQRNSASAWVLALIALALMLAWVGNPPVQRTQEARVMETAREMLGRGWHDWMIPHLNGKVRVEKPPLAYWVAAIAFKIGGVNEFAGRVPFVLVGWLTMLITAAVARKFFACRVAFLSAAILVGGMMFARYARLAETDVLATCAATAAIASIWIGIDATGRAGERWFLLSGAMIGLAIMAKGLPGVFPLFYLIATAAPRKDVKLLWRWIRSGAPLLVILIGVPWWAYMLSSIGFRIFKRELHDGIEGRDHAGSFIQYFPDLLRAFLPYAIILVAAIALAGRRWKRDSRLRELIIWFCAIFIPLLFNGQRQFHYLLPLLPPLAILCAWLLDAAIDRTIEHWSFVKLLFFITAVGLIVAGIALPVVAMKMRGAIALRDWIFFVAAIVTGVLPLIASGLDFTPLPGEPPTDPESLKLARDTRRLFASVVAFAVASAIFMQLLTTLWIPTLRTSNPRTIAAGVRSVGNGPFYFYGQNISLTLLFYVGEIMPQVTSPNALTQAAADHPKMIVIAQTKSGVSPPPLPPEFEYVKTITSEDQTYGIARLRR